MKTNVESLKTLYTKLGGALTDTYPNIAGGIPVGEYDLISDCILACSEKSSGGGGGGDEYETVAEISVGTMELADGKYMYTIPTGTDLPDGELYWDTADQPLTKYTSDGDVWAYNFDAEFNVLGTPAYAITVFSEEEESATIVVSDTNAIENTTVSILKKVSGGGIAVDSVLSATSENPVQNKVITAALADKADKADLKEPLIVHGTADYVNQTAEITDDISLSDIYTAAASGRYVAFECSLDEGNTTRIHLSSYSLDNGEYSFVFTNAALQSDKPAVISAEFENNTTGTFSFNVSQ